jgi:glucose-1-phosphate adenylyltransferase
LAGKGGKKADPVDSVASIILAGGQGTRLFPLTQSRCKPAVAFGGRYRLIDIPLSNSINSGIRQIFVISQYFATSLQQHIITTYPSPLFAGGKIELICPEETSSRKVWFKGTADAIRQNLDHLHQTTADYFLILSGDQLYNIHFEKMLAFAKQQDADLVVAALKVPEKEAKRMGLLKLNEKGAITDFYEKPTDPATLKKFQLEGDPRFLGSMGIYIFKREALFSILKGEGEDFGKHIIPSQVKKGKAYGFVYDGYWVDIGTIASYYEANLALTREKICLDTYDENNPIYAEHNNLPCPNIKSALIKESLISEGAIIEAQEISHSIVGIRAHIKKGSVIRDSILLGNHCYHPPCAPIDFTIGENCLIEKAIIDENTRIGDGVQLTNKKRLQTFDGDGVYIRDGIIIVTTGTQLPDNFTL